MLTLEIAMMHWVGLTELTPRSYTPIALLNQDPAAVLVNAASPHTDIRALAEALRAAPPRQFKGTGSGRGGSWHLAFVGWLRAMGLRPTTCSGCRSRAPRSGCRSWQPAASISRPAPCRRAKA